MGGEEADDVDGNGGIRTRSGTLGFVLKLKHACGVVDRVEGWSKS